MVDYEKDRGVLVDGQQYSLVLGFPEVLFYPLNHWQDPLPECVYLHNHRK